MAERLSNLDKTGRLVRRGSCVTSDKLAELGYRFAVVVRVRLGKCTVFAHNATFYGVICESLQVLGRAPR